MRTYGRARNDDGTFGPWVEVQTTIETGDDLVWATTLCQVMALNINESPFYADYGIPAKTAVIQQVAPDFFVMRTQQRFAQYFANLVVAREPDGPEPTYRVNVTTRQGVRLDATVAIPQ